MDEVDVDQFIREASAAIDDPDTLSQFLREKVTIAIERFLNYCTCLLLFGGVFLLGRPDLTCFSFVFNNEVPKMSIPVERREIGEGFVLTCRGEDGNDLTLTDVNIRRENLVCQILGGDSLFFPMFAGDDNDTSSRPPNAAVLGVRSDVEEESVLDHIRVLLLQAQSYDCWKEGIGGVSQVS
jgi:hypothetical protein